MQTVVRSRRSLGSVSLERRWLRKSSPAACDANPIKTMCKRSREAMVVLSRCLCSYPRPRAGSTGPSAGPPPQDVRLAFTHGAEGGGRARRGVPGRRACTSASLRWDSVPVHGVLKVTQTRALEWAGAALLQRVIRCPLCMAAPARVRERGGRAPARLSPTSVCFNARSTGFPGGLPSRH